MHRPKSIPLQSFYPEIVNKERTQLPRTPHTVLQEIHRKIQGTKKPLYRAVFSGANEGTRTLDLLITNQLRYQLCHVGVSTTAIVSYLASACQSFRAKILIESAFNIAVI